MNQAVSQPAGAKQRVDLRQQMPETAKWVEQQRQTMGAAHVNDCIKRALKGEPGLFYALECGHVLGTPFPPTTPEYYWQRLAIATGSGFAAFIATPAQEGAQHGTH